MLTERIAPILQAALLIVIREIERPERLGPPLPLRSQVGLQENPNAFLRGVERRTTAGDMFAACSSKRLNDFTVGGVRTHQAGLSQVTHECLVGIPGITWNS
jgi:hypothetical protein